MTSEQRATGRQMLEYTREWNHAMPYLRDALDALDEKDKRIAELEEKFNHIDKLWHTTMTSLGITSADRDKLKHEGREKDRQIERLRTALESIRKEMSVNYGCNHPDEGEQNDDGRCSGDDCKKCWMEHTIDAALSAPAEPAEVKV